MKVLLINGSPHEKGCTYTALAEVAGELKKNGVDTEFFWIGVKPIHGCIGCWKCREKKKCVFDDAVNECLAKIDGIDGLVIGSPVYFAGPAGEIQTFLDRFFAASCGRLANKVGAAVVSCRRGGATAAFERLNLYFGMNNLVVATSQYWNQVHGNTPDEVRQDAEGLQTMRTLAVNMAWLMKSIEAGRKAGLPPPKREPAAKTNFIR